MSLKSETMVIRSCNADKILLTFSGAQRCGASTKPSKFEDFPALIKSEPISFGVHKPRLRCTDSQSSHCSAKMSQNIQIPRKKKVKRNSTLNASCESSVERKKQQSDMNNASQIPKKDTVTCTVHTTTVHSDQLLRRSETLTCPVTDVCVEDADDDDEGFAEPAALIEHSDSSSANSSSSSSATSQPPAIMVHDTASSSCSSDRVRHECFSSERSRLDSNSDSSVGMAVFGSPDMAAIMPHLWTNTTQPHSDNDLASNPQSYAKLPFHHGPHDETDEEDDMEGTDLLHLISNSLDRFNAIVHPDELSRNTSGVGTSVDGADALLSASRNPDDFPPNECAQNHSDPTHSGGIRLDQLLGKSADVKFAGTTTSSWLQYSVSCPTETRPGDLDIPLSSGRPRLFNSVLNHSTPPVGSNQSARPTLLPVEAEDYLREFGAIANKENPQNLPNILHLPSSFCALTSTLLDPDSSHVTSQVKDTTMALIAPTAGSKDTSIPPPGFAAPNWTEMLVTRTTHTKDEDQNSPSRRRESVLTALQDSAIRTHESSWFGFSGRSPDWTGPVDGTTTTASTLSTQAEGLGFDPLPRLVDPADSQTAHAFVRPLLTSCGRSRLLSSCLCSEQDGKYGVTTSSSSLDPCSNRYPELFNSDWNVSSLPKEFAESLRFLIPTSSVARSTGSSDEPSGHTLRNTHASSTPNVTPLPLTRLLSGASVGRQHVTPKLSNMKTPNGTKQQQEKMRNTPSSQRRYYTTEPAPLLSGSFGRPTDYSFFRPQRHASLSCSANHNNTRHASSGGARSGGSSGNPNVGSSDSAEGQIGAKPTVAKWRRACSFYLRGHCKKEDCEFAHDLTKVTCKFWEMGECFKGATCPFLHGYPPELAEIQP